MMKPVIFSIEVIGATNRQVYQVGFRIHDRRIKVIHLEDRFFGEVPTPMYVCKGELNEVLATISAAAPVVVEFKYELEE